MSCKWLQNHSCKFVVQFPQQVSSSLWLRPPERAIFTCRARNAADVSTSCMQPSYSPRACSFISAGKYRVSGWLFLVWNVANIGIFHYALMMSLNHGFCSFIRYIFENSYKPHLFMTFKIYVLTFFSGVYPKFSLFRDGLWRVTFLSLVRTALSGFSFYFHGDLITARILLHVIFPKKWHNFSILLAPQCY